MLWIKLHSNPFKHPSKSLENYNIKSIWKNVSINAMQRVSSSRPSLALGLLYFLLNSELTLKHLANKIMASFHCIETTDRALSIYPGDHMTLASSLSFIFYLCLMLAHSTASNGIHSLAIFI